MSSHAAWRTRLTEILRRWFFWAMLAVLVLSIGIWWFTRDTLPEPLRIATGNQGGLYHELGDHLAEAFFRNTNHETHVIATQGSNENASLLRERKAEAAILQSGACDLDRLAVVAPLYPDVVQVLVRKPANGGSAVKSILDLRAKKIIVGPEGSGMRFSALSILQHYKLADAVTLDEAYFTSILEDESSDAAIVTTGLQNPDLARVLESGRFGLLALDGNALANKFGHFEYFEIPSQMWPPTPPEPVPTVACPAVLAVHEDASPLLVTRLLDSLYSEGVANDFPNLYHPTDNYAKRKNWRFHRTARSYHDPLGGVGWFFDSLENIAAGKELLFALFASLYLIWDQWTRAKSRERDRLMRREKEELAKHLDKTLRIEKSLLRDASTERLEGYLRDVTEIKLNALQQLTHEDIRDEQAFLVFLAQCSDLVRRIQARLGSQKRE